MKLLILGSGNLLKALFPGPLLGFETYVYSPTKANAENFASVIQGTPCESSGSLPSPKEVKGVILGMKPQHLLSARETFEPYLKELPKTSWVMSLLAAMTLKDLSTLFPHSKHAWIRVMPNTNTRVGEGILMHTELPEKNLLEKLFLGRGVFLPVSEDQLEKLTPLVGSAPAYVAFLGTLFQGEMEKLGVKPEEAINLSKTLLSGSLKRFSLNPKSNFKDFQKEVASKGGVTERALEVLGESVPEIFSKALKEARKRSQEMREKIQKK